MKCSRCGVHGITYGHQGLCGVHYTEYRAHQETLRKLSDEARAAREARDAHPAGKSAKRRAANRWIRKLYCNCLGFSNGPCPVHKEESV